MRTSTARRIRRNLGKLTFVAASMVGLVALVLILDAFNIASCNVHMVGAFFVLAGAAILAWNLSEEWRDA